MVFPQIAQNRKKSIIAAETLIDVIAKNYAVGDKLPPERYLAEMMTISRNTLREAIAALQLMGIIEVRHSQGNFIVSMPQQANDETIISILDEDNSPSEAAEVRLALEPGIAWLCADRMLPAELNKLKKAEAILEKALDEDDVSSYVRADCDIHMTIAQGTHNQKLVGMLEPYLHVRQKPLWKAMKQGLDRNAILEVRKREHRSIVEALLQRNSQKASNEMRSHLQNSLARFLIDVESSSVN